MKARPQAWKVCPHVDANGSCPVLVNAQNPCPKHGRPVNAPWSKDRDRNTQRQFRTDTLRRDGFTCRRCGHHDRTGATLDAHHVSPTQGLTLCNSKANGCHSAHDRNAR